MLSTASWSYWSFRNTSSVQVSNLIYRFIVFKAVSNLKVLTISFFNQLSLPPPSPLQDYIPWFSHSYTSFNNSKYHKFLIKWILSLFISIYVAEIVTPEQLREGRRQLQRHKRTTQRTYQRKNLSSMISNTGKDSKAGSGFFLWRMFGFQSVPTTAGQADVFAAKGSGKEEGVEKPRIYVPPGIKSLGSFFFDHSISSYDSVETYSNSRNFNPHVE